MIQPLTPARGSAIMTPIEPLPAWFREYLEARYRAIQQEFAALNQEKAYIVKVLGKDEKVKAGGN